MLFDLEQDPAPDPDPPPFTPEPPPGDVEIMADVAKQAVAWPYRLVQLGNQFVRQGATYVRHTVGSAPTTHPFQAPRTSFNGTLTPSRSFASASTSLAEAKAVKDAFGVKLNDVVPATVSGALRSYLTDLGEMPDAPFVAQVPVSMRADPDQHIGTKVSMMFAAMATDIEDPAERLRTIYATTSAAKEMRAALTAQQIMGLTDNTPLALVGLAARAWTAGGFDSGALPVFNVIVSNVPGPPFDLYVGRSDRGHVPDGSVALRSGHQRDHRVERRPARLWDPGLSRSRARRMGGRPPFRACVRRVVGRCR